MSDVLRSYLNAKEKLNKSMPETQDRMDALGDYYTCSHAYAKWFHGQETYDRLLLTYNTLNEKYVTENYKYMNKKPNEDEYIILWEMFVKRYNAERAILDCLVETGNLTEQDSNEGMTE
jgi:hypothetical protein